MVTGLIRTDIEGRILDIINQQDLEGLFKVPEPGMFSIDNNMISALAETERFKLAQKIPDAFVKRLKSLSTSKEPVPKFRDEIDHTMIFIYYSKNSKQFYYMIDPQMGSYLRDFEHMRHLMTNPITTAGGYLEQILKLCEHPEAHMHLDAIKNKTEIALQEIRILERLTRDITIIQRLESGKFELRPENNIRLLKDIIEPIAAAFNKSYGERKIGIKYEDSLDKEVLLTADRIGLLFITSALFSIPIINSRVHDFHNFSVSYGYEPQKRNGKDMHVIIYWTRWPNSAKEPEKMLATSEYATSGEGKVVPKVGLKYSQMIADKHGGHIEVDYKPHKGPKAEMEFRLYVPIEQDLNTNSQK